MIKKLIHKLVSNCDKCFEKENRNDTDLELYFKLVAGYYREADL